ncbi:MAG: hypothetical protein GX175_08975 [Halanaerobiaceae bacterium]|jgi:sporulation protein YlmC with PRC-barrel domain|nr:hypothetical protein [Halanaerobiaceae bacterium]
MLPDDLIGKEVVDLLGKKLGLVKKENIIIEAGSGRVESIIINNDNNKYIIPCNGIRHIGSIVVLIDNAVNFRV